MSFSLIKNARIINEDRCFEGDILLRGERIEKIAASISHPSAKEFDADGNFVLPGLIDDQVHFREPGLTHKADIQSESRAAVAGGITSFMEMPNTVPNTLTQALLEEKFAIAAERSLANHSFFMGTSNDNYDELMRTDPKTVCGIKIFMGASTGNMLVDSQEVLEKVFANAPVLIATHCEHEPTVRQNTAAAKEKYGASATAALHPIIRNEDACYRSSSFAVDLARKHGTRLHVLHISTARELSLFSADLPLAEKKITAEACIHHLWFTQEDYAEKGNFIKWNPAIKSASDREAIRQAVVAGVIDVLATDHAPHTLQEKSLPYFEAPAGGPLVQHALPALFELVREGVFTPELIVRRYCHAVADCFHIRERGYIREGYYADLTQVDPAAPWKVSTSNILYKCGWSPFEGTEFHSSVKRTWVNGRLVYDHGRMDISQPGKRLHFDR
ncbi:MAG: dihydroorotase [Bacteroidota bacterium]